ncbi:DNA cytosine methyltransferase [Paenibacillus kyungheensis]
MSVSIFSFFSGSGFLDLGFEKANYQIVEVNEFYEPFLKAYKFSRERMNIPSPKYGYHAEDITNYLNSDNLKNHILLERQENLVGFIGGPPCPDFSLAGKNKGSEGENGKLTKTYFELIVKEKPDFFLFENVKGLLKTKKHKIFYDEMKTLIQNNGYIIRDCLLNALQYGVPQDRERIFMVGFLKSSLKEDSNEIQNMIEDFDWGINLRNVSEIKNYTWPQPSEFLVDNVLDMPNNIVPELTVEHWFKENDVYNHFNSKDYFKPRQALEKFTTILEGDISKKSFKRLHRWRYSPTVAYGNNEVHLHPYKIRRLSASEALAIQSLPKEFALPESMTLTDKFKTIGNGVPYSMSNGIAQSLYKLISNIF